METKEAAWTPKVGDIVEYVGSKEGSSDDYMGGVGVVTGINPTRSWTPQILIDWIVPPAKHRENIKQAGLWAGNCKKLTEVENG